MCAFFVANPPSLNHFMLESAKNTKKKPYERNLAHNIKHMTNVFEPPYVRNCKKR